MTPRMCREAGGMMLVSGAQTTFRRAEAVLKAMTGKLDYLGERRDLAAANKLFGNAMIVTLCAGLADVYAMAGALGIEAREAHALFGKFNPAGVLAYRGAAIAAGDTRRPRADHRTKGHALRSQASSRAATSRRSQRSPARIDTAHSHRSHAAVSACWGRRMASRPAHSPPFHTESLSSTVPPKTKAAARHGLLYGPDRSSKSASPRRSRTPSSCCPPALDELLAGGAACSAGGWT